MLKLRYIKILVFLMALLIVTSGLSAVAAQRQLFNGDLPSLGTAENFAILAGSTATNTGSTVITGDLGVWPGTTVTGFPPGIVNGTIYEGGAVAQQAQSDLLVAYNDLAGRACDVDLSGTDLGGLTLTEAVYCFSSSAQLTGQLTLDAQGNADALFIFQMGSTLTTASNSSVQVINNGTECNVFWQVGSSATLGTSTMLGGNILALTSVTLNTSADVSGRALALNGAVTTDTNNVSNGSCSFGPTPTPSSTSTPTSTPLPPTNVDLTNFSSENPASNSALWLLFPLALAGIAVWIWQKRQTASK